MKYSVLGNTGLEVSQLAVGAALFREDESAIESYGSTFVRQKEADGIVNLAIDEGINLFDTAHRYGEGQSEIVLGKALGSRRHEIVLATKCGGLQTGIDGSINYKSSRRVIMQQVENSLRRLKTDWIDLYQVHVFDASTPIEETLRALDDLVHQGKVRYIGMSNFSGWQLAMAVGLSQALGLASYCSIQLNYTLVSRGAERELLPAAMNCGVGALVWSPLSRGFLAGIKRADEYSSEEISRLCVLIDDPNRALTILKTAEQIADEHSATVARVALAWLLQKPGVTSLLLGVLNEDQLRDNLCALDLQLSEEETQRLDQISELPIEYPGWVQMFMKSESPEKGLMGVNISSTDN